MIELSGKWIEASRRVYRTHTDPYFEVLDRTWEGDLSSAAPIAGVAFVCAGPDLYWVKSRPPAASLDVRINMGAFANDTRGAWTASLSLGGSVAPAVPATFPAAVPSLACAPGAHRPGVALSLLRTDSVELLVLVLPGRLLSVGRNRLWRLREEQAAQLPEPVRLLLTTRRTGRLTSDGASAGDSG